MNSSFSPITNYESLITSYQSPSPLRATATYCELLLVNSTFNPCLADFFFFAPQTLCAFALPRSCNSCHSWFSYPFCRPTCDSLRSLADSPEIACDNVSSNSPNPNLSPAISTHLNPSQPKHLFLITPNFIIAPLPRPGRSPDRAGPDNSRSILFQPPTTPNSSRALSSADRDPP